MCPPKETDSSPETIRGFRPFSWLAIFAIRGYQKLISPMIGPNCRFHPTCSQYTLEAIQKYGSIRGILKGCWRIMRCNPWNAGGYDPP